MAVDGAYSIEIQSPMGVQSAKFSLTADGASLSGTFSDQNGEQAIQNGKASGDEFTFPVKMNTPMGEVQLEFKGTVSSDAVSGQVQAGSFGSFPFKGARS